MAKGAWERYLIKNGTCSCFPALTFRPSPPRHWPGPECSTRSVRRRDPFYFYFCSDQTAATKENTKPWSRVAFSCKIFWKVTTTCTQGGARQCAQEEEVTRAGMQIWTITRTSIKTEARRKNFVTYKQNWNAKMHHDAHVDKNGSKKEKLCHA